MKVPSKLSELLFAIFMILFGITFFTGFAYSDLILGVLALAHGPVVGVLPPVAGGVRRVDLVDHDDLPVGGDPHLVLGVDEDQAPLAGPLLAPEQQLWSAPRNVRAA